MPNDAIPATAVAVPLVTLPAVVEVGVRVTIDVKSTSRPPSASCALTAGCVESAALRYALDGWVVNTSFVATIRAVRLVEVVESVPSDAVRKNTPLSVEVVYFTPENVDEPLTAVEVVPPAKVPPKPVVLRVIIDA